MSRVYESKSKDINAFSIGQLTEDAAEQMLQTARWGSLTEQECPVCHRISAHWYRRTRRQWRCRYEDCAHTFSVTSGTALANTKIEPQKLLMAAFHFIESPDAAPAKSMGRILGTADKTSFLLMHRFRNAIMRMRDPHAQDGLLDPNAMTVATEADLRLEGEVEIDAGYFCHPIRAANRRAQRIDRRRAHNMNPHKRCVLVMRQRGPTGQGAAATRLAVIDSEMGFPMDRLVPKYVREGSTVYTDEQPAYQCLGRNNRYTLHQVDHNEAYRSPEGYHENQAESFFARMRKQQRRLNGGAAKYLLAYAHEAAWREDLRRATLQEKLFDLLRCCMQVRPSPDWIGYYQHRRQTLDPLWLRDRQGGIVWARDELSPERPARLWARMSVKGLRHPRAVREPAPLPLQRPLF